MNVNNIIRHGECARIPDVVVYPGTHQQVEVIVKAANEHNVVIIPFGGGTSVTNAVTCDPAETRMIVSLDMREMNKVKWIGIPKIKRKKKQERKSRRERERQKREREEW